MRTTTTITWEGAPSELRAAWEAMGRIEGDDAPAQLARAMASAVAQEDPAGAPPGMLVSTSTTVDVPETVGDIARAADAALERLRLALLGTLPAGDPSRATVDRLVAEGRHDVSAAINVATRSRRASNAAS